MSVPFDQMQAALPAVAPGLPVAAPAAPPPAPKPVVSEEKVKALFEELDAAIAFDDTARRDYAFCRRYARGDSHWEVSVNLIGTYIDIMVAFLYARNPDVAVMVSKSCGNQRKAEAKQFATTMEVVLSRAWKDIRLKRAAERWVRSVLTIGIGWLKSGWQELYETDPAIQRRVRDVQENLARIRKLEEEIGGGLADDTEKAQEELQAQLYGLEQHVEKLSYRGLFVDFLPGEHVVVSTDVQNLIDCEGAKWIAHLNYMTLKEAKAKWPQLPATDWEGVETFHINKPVDVRERNRTAATIDDISASEADNYRGGTDVSGKVDAGKHNCFVQHVEMWRADENLVYDLIRGVKKSIDCDGPNVGTTRFYPFFPLAFNEVDGERHPQSLVMRTYKLIDEYHRTRSGKAELRRRIKPKMAFDARAHTPQQIGKITRGEYGEYIPLKPAVEGVSLKDSIWEMNYPRIDPALFELVEVRQELETMWGIQEALSGGIQVAKTATEAEIQQAGTQARTGSMRDRGEGQLTQMAQYHAEILIQKLELEDVAEIAGPEAIWPKVDVEDLDLLVNIEIAAGTTGKPNTTAQREAWAAELPVIEKTIMAVGQLLMSPPQEMARCLTELMEETLIRAGDDRVDIERFIPQAGQPVQLIDPVTLQPVLAYPAPGQGGEQPSAGGGTIPGDVALPPGGDPTLPQGEAVAPVDLPPQIA